jgi:5'-nucleotidase
VVRDGNRIEGPIPVRAAALFHGRRVRANRALERMLRPVFANAAPLRDKVLATADGPINGREVRENGMGDLITDALLANTGADFALINAGGIRSAFGAGPITYGAVFETLPFENKVAVVRVSGRDLKRILRVAESGATGYFPVAGLRLTISTCQSCPGDDLDGDGRVDRWENNRLLGIERSDGSPVRDDDEYTLATLDFVIQGGDYMGWPFSQIPPDRIRYTSVLARDALVQLLEQRQHIKSDSGSLAPGARPRLIFVEGGEAAGTTER